ncbi:hypothetical protein BABINDRAFT_99767 [Babjeviella inositovora NRRL Y-12698]|uniref:Uncharacterized protein n=1 Tax=Babjeviella inositovora NRRL Y-12698 TaxID=984486 RepID=A0A1E3QIK5_9ASCO|nr:uncharacterized protein BABINDRAFT_99767 [Babjeviella inositovora NRRL Y-12698]ODQ77274.1 hypothetical protein BABINDRAFT_99767 [Babjeviella inositovora NRRL Y-12698]
MRLAYLARVHKQAQAGLPHARQVLNWHTHTELYRIFYKHWVTSFDLLATATKLRMLSSDSYRLLLYGPWCGTSCAWLYTRRVSYLLHFSHVACLVHW